EGGRPMPLRAHVDRHRCIGAGTCITIAPTAFDWHEGDFAKSGIMDPSSVDEELLREAALACPTGAIGVEEIEELLPWQLRGKEAPRRVEKTFMFTDIEGSTNLVEALADGGQSLSSIATAADGRFPISEPRTVTLRGTSEPVEIVTVDWA